MKRQLTSVALKSYLAAPPAIQKAFDKQVKLLVENIHHPSLRAKKYNEAATHTLFKTSSLTPNNLTCSSIRGGLCYP